MPEPAPSEPDHETVKSGAVVVAGKAADGARGGRDVDRVDDLGRGDRRVGVEDDARLGVEGRAGGQAGLGLDREVNVAFAVGRIGVGRQEADERVRRRVERRRIERRERDRQQAGAQVQARVDVDIHAERGDRVDPRAKRRQARRHVHDVTAKPDRAELERAPIQVRAELLGDDDVVGGDLGGFLVGEFDRVGERAAGRDESDRPIARGAKEIVGIVRELGYLTRRRPRCRIRCRAVEAGAEAVERRCNLVAVDVVVSRPSRGAIFTPGIGLYQRPLLWTPR